MLIKYYCYYFFQLFTCQVVSRRDTLYIDTIIVVKRRNVDIQGLRRSDVQVERRGNRSQCRRRPWRCLSGVMGSTIFLGSQDCLGMYILGIVKK